MSMETTQTTESVDPNENAPAPASSVSRSVVAYDDRDRQVIASVVGNNELTNDELDFVMAQASRLNLDVMTKHMHAWKQDGKLIMTVGIDGLRLVASRTGKYRGRTDPEWLHPELGWVDAWVYDIYPLAARVRVLHADYDQPMTGTAVWAESAKTKMANGQRVPVRQWAQMPAHMLAKVAEAMAIRAAFPAELGGIYTDDELDRADAMIRDSGDAQRMPGADDPVVLDVERRLAALPDEARARLESWWTDNYAEKVLRITGIAPICDGGLRRFTGDSEHVKHWADMIGRAEQKLAGAAEPAPAGGQPTEPETGPADEPAATPSDSPAETSEPADGAVDPSTGLTPLESGILTALAEIGSGRSVDIAQQMGRQSPDGNMRTVIAALFDRDLIELDPDAEQGRGPLRVWRRNEQMIEAMTEHYNDESDAQ